jgi:hypothetical protein
MLSVFIRVHPWLLSFFEFVQNPLAAQDLSNDGRKIDDRKMANNIRDRA